MENESEDDSQAACNADRCFPGRGDPAQRVVQGCATGAPAHRSTIARESARVRPQMSLIFTSTLAFPAPMPRRIGRRRLFAPADRLRNVREARVVRPRRSRRRAVARSASERRTVAALRVVEVLKLEKTAAAQRSNAALSSTGAVIVRLHGFLPEHAPPQVRKRELPFGTARSVTELARRNE